MLPAALAVGSKHAHKPFPRSDTDKDKSKLYPLFAAGKRYLELRGSLREAIGKQSGLSQRTLEEVNSSVTRQKVDLLLVRASAEQGNVSDSFWQNKSLRKALRLLAEAKPMGYTVPHRKRIGGELRKDVVDLEA